MMGRRGFLKFLGVGVLGLSLALRRPEPVRVEVVAVHQHYSEDMAYEVITDRVSDKVTLQDDALVQFMTRRFKMGYPDPRYWQLTGYAERYPNPNAYGWAFSRSWFIEARA